ncbi:2-hydroxyacid dehydrogenase [Necropsobacter rosorum]|uniref:2-hydroxyacid dehydrogenase n=1 Tax=Necropsobacter rosorum TaxID=908285 RepID=UPI000509B421
MTNPPILKVEKVPELVVDMLSADYTVLAYETMTAAQFAEVAETVQVILASGESSVPANLIEKLPHLKLIAVFGVGYDGVDMPAALAKGVKVTHTPDVLTDDVADLGMALMLATARRIVAAQRFIESQQWGKQPSPLATKVSGSRLGIVGFGRVGQAVAKRAAAFNMQIGYFSLEQVPDSPYTYYADLSALARQSDVLMLCLSGGTTTKHIVNADILQALGNKGILINIARGSVVDEQALVHAIENHIIAGAGLDVFADEPHVPPALLHNDRVVVTPHIGSATLSTRTAMGRLVVDNIDLFFARKALKTPVPECRE